MGTRHLSCSRIAAFSAGERSAYNQSSILDSPQCQNLGLEDAPYRHINSLLPPAYGRSLSCTFMARTLADHYSSQLSLFIYISPLLLAAICDSCASTWRWVGFVGRYLASADGIMVSRRRCEKAKLKCFICFW